MGRTDEHACNRSGSHDNHYDDTIGARGSPTGSLPEYPRANPPPTHPDRLDTPYPLLAPISQVEYTSTARVPRSTRTLHGRGARSVEGEQSGPVMGHPT